MVIHGCEVAAPASAVGGNMTTTTTTTTVAVVVSCMAVVKGWGKPYKRPHRTKSAHGT